MPQHPIRRCTEVPDNDVSSFELDHPVVGVEYNEDELRAFDGVSGQLGRSKLVEALAVSVCWGFLGWGSACARGADA